MYDHDDDVSYAYSRGFQEGLDQADTDYLQNRISYYDAGYENGLEEGELRAFEKYVLPLLSRPWPEYQSFEHFPKTGKIKYERMCPYCASNTHEEHSLKCPLLNLMQLIGIA